MIPLEESLSGWRHWKIQIAMLNTRQAYIREKGSRNLERRDEWGRVMERGVPQGFGGGRAGPLEKLKHMGPAQRWTAREDDQAKSVMHRHAFF